jgi:DNA-binding XRE family transcriptional regulator
MKRVGKIRMMTQVEKLRRAYRLTYGMLAARVGLSPSSVHAICWGQSVPGYSTAHKFSTLFGVPIHKLFEEFKVDSRPRDSHERSTYRRLIEGKRDVNVGFALYLINKYAPRRKHVI